MGVDSEELEGQSFPRESQKGSSKRARYPRGEPTLSLETLKQRKGPLLLPSFHMALLESGPAITTEKSLGELSSPRHAWTEPPIMWHM